MPCSVDYHIPGLRSENDMKKEKEESGGGGSQGRHRWHGGVRAKEGNQEGLAAFSSLSELIVSVYVCVAVLWKQSLFFKHHSGSNGFPNGKVVCPFTWWLFQEYSWFPTCHECQRWEHEVLFFVIKQKKRFLHLLAAFLHKSIFWFFLLFYN